MWVVVEDSTVTNYSVDSHYIWNPHVQVDAVSFYHNHELPPAWQLEDISVEDVCNLEMNAWLSR